MQLTHCVLLVLDPPKQPEYSMKARLSGIFLDLYYDSTSIHSCGLAPTLASELRPIKGVSAVSEKDCGKPPSSAATSLECRVEECLQAELCELNISVMVIANLQAVLICISV
jgi:hypothetical protein